MYCFDANNPSKQEIAKQLISQGGWCVSWQVIQEFSSVALHRFKVPLKPEDLSDYIVYRLWPECRVLPSEAIFNQAVAIHGRYGFRFYDCLILASAQAADAKTLFSGDLQHGQQIGSLEVVNPFLKKQSRNCA